MIAGEVSGDLHGGGVVRELKRRIPDMDIYGVGGESMKAEGMELLYHINDLSIMGFTEVVRHLPLLRRVERSLEQCLVERRPQVVVLIDYPGFNLRFARKAKRYGVKLLYYISPQIWAWNHRRVHRMKKVIDEMDVVFGFEVDLYKKEGINVAFVGHPLAERLRSVSTKEEFLRTHGLDSGKKLIALLPGSRRQEIESVLPTMLDAVDALRRSHQLQAAIGVAPGLGREFISSFLSDRDEVALVEHSPYGLMEHADAAVVTSGTATLETGWFGTPMVVVYRTSVLTFLIGKLLVTVPHIGLVNILCGRRVVPELIQMDLTVENLVAEADKILLNDLYSQSMRNDLGEVRTKLGTPGASARVAENILSLARAA